MLAPCEILALWRLEEPEFETCLWTTWEKQLSTEVTCDCRSPPTLSVVATMPSTEELLWDLTQGYFSTLMMTGPQT